MSYENKSQVGQFDSYAALRNQNISSDILGRQPVNISIFQTMYAGCNALRFNDLQKIIIKEVIKGRASYLNTISPAPEYSLDTKTFSNININGISTAQESLRAITFAMRTADILKAYSETDDAYDSTSPIFVDTPDEMRLSDDVDVFVGTAPVSIENALAKVYTDGENFLDIGTIIYLTVLVDSGYSYSDDTVTPFDCYSADKKIEYLYSSGQIGWESDDAVSLHEYNDQNVNVFFGNCLKFSNIGAVDDSFSLISVAPQAITPEIGLGKNTAYTMVSGRQLLVTRPSSESIKVYGSMASGDISFKELYSDDNISIGITTSKIVVCVDTEKHIQEVSGITFSDLREIKEVTRSPVYHSFILIFDDLSVYVAIRRENVFSGGHLMPDRGMWHLYVTSSDTAEDDAATVKGISKPDIINSMSPENYKKMAGGIFTREAYTRGYAIVGTKDLKFKSEFAIYNKYGATDFRIVDGGWFDTAEIVTKVNGVALCLDNCYVFPNPFITEYRSLSSGVTNLKESFVNHDKPQGDIWVGVLPSNTSTRTSTGNPKNSSIVTFSELSISLSGGYHELPRASEEVLGYDVTQGFMKWESNFLHVEQKDFVQSGDSLYEASKMGVLMPNPDKKVLSGYHDYYNLGNYIIASTDKGLDIYSYDSRSGIMLQNSIPGTSLCRGAIFKNTLYFFTKDTMGSHNLYKIDREGILLAYTRKYSTPNYTAKASFIVNQDALLLCWKVDGSSTLKILRINETISFQEIDYIPTAHFFKTKIDGKEKVYLVNGTTYREIKENYNDVFDIESQYINLTQPSKVFVLDNIVIDVEALYGNASYKLEIYSNENKIVTVNDNLEYVGDYIKRHKTGSLPITGLKYKFNGQKIRLNNISIEGYYQEVE